MWKTNAFKNTKGSWKCVHNLLFQLHPKVFQRFDMIWMNINVSVSSYHALTERNRCRCWWHYSDYTTADVHVLMSWVELSVVELSWVLSAVELTRWSLSLVFGFLWWSSCLTTRITEGQGTPQQMFNCSCAVGNSARTPLYRRTIKSSQIEIFLVFRMFETTYKDWKT